MEENKEFYGKRIENKRLLIFLGLCFGMSWLMELFGVIPMYRSGDLEAVTEAAELISQIMLAPALAALVARLFTREGLVNAGCEG